MSKKKTEKRLQQIYDEIVDSRPKMLRDFKEEDFNSYIVVGFLPRAPINIMIGRIVQIRMEAGAFGSNQIFLRQYDHGLHVHENQWFYKVPEWTIPILDEIFKDIGPENPTKTYSIRNEEERSGFVIASPIKEGETTPMREVKKKLEVALFGKKS